MDTGSMDLTTFGSAGMIIIFMGIAIKWLVNQLNDEKEARQRVQAEKEAVLNLVVPLVQKSQESVALATQTIDRATRIFDRRIASANSGEEG